MPTTCAAPMKVPGAMDPDRHPRNRHGARYDYRALVARDPGLEPFVQLHPRGGSTIDFTRPEAVMALNRALLLTYYGLEEWSVPPGYLCPPVPGRADYIHHLADLLAGDGALPRGPGVSILDIGTGASVIFPVLGIAEYGWRFTGTETEAGALRSAQATVVRNPGLRDRVELRWQEDATRIFAGTVREGEFFDACLCNPPFYSTAEEAAAESLRKEALMGVVPESGTPVRHFGGRPHELWCEGGEAWFVGRMIRESAAIPGCCRWFTSYVSGRGSLPHLRKELAEAGAAEVREIGMTYRAKKSRILAWRFTRG